MDRRQFLTRATVVAFTVVAGSAGAQISGTYHFEVVHERAVLAGLRAPLRIAWLTDLHHGQHVRTPSVRAWVDAALDHPPDVILLGGDLVDHTPGVDADDGLAAELARLRAPLGVLAVAGNHDHARFRGIEPYATLLGDAGIEVLVNRGVSVRDDLHVAGLDDLRNGRPDLGATLRDRGSAGATACSRTTPTCCRTYHWTSA